MLHALKHATLDSLKVFGFSLIIYILLSFVEEKISNILKKNKNTTPILGSLLGLIPQCGISVVAADLYIKKHISMGALFAVFFACSDEAMPILLSGGEKAIYAIPLLIIKFVFGFIIGYLIDFFHTKNINSNEEIDDIHIGCCHHEIDNNESKIKTHLIHPLIHSLKILIYVFIVNFIFEIAIHFIGENNIYSFITSTKYLSPIFTSIIGLVPNCASSVLITELFIENGIPFGALVSGLAVNSGLGLIYLLKSKENIKNTFIILALLFISSILIGYLALLII